MRSVSRFILVPLVALLSGCLTASRSPWIAFDSSRTPKPAPAPQSSGKRQTYEFVIKSEPSGAEVFTAVSGREYRLGKTPLKFSQEFELKREAFYLPRSWYPVASRSVLQSSRDDRHHIFVKLPEIELRIDGYKSQRFKYVWQFPDDLKKRITQWESQPLPRNYEQTVYFQNPTRAEFNCDITLNCLNPGAQVYALDARGEIGKLAGAAPLPVRLGLARTRSAAGAFGDWLRWNDEHADIVKVDRSGNLYLRCALVNKGYKPVKLVDRAIGKVEGTPAQKISATFRMTDPTEPESEFKLSVDSRPTGAEVFERGPGNALGQKLGQTPFVASIGIAQVLKEMKPGQYVHDNWRIFLPKEMEGIVQWESDPRGVTQVYLVCALFKENLSVEEVTQPIFTLVPGKEIPTGAVFNIPIYSPTEKAVRLQLPKPGAPSSAPPLGQAPSSDEPPAYQWTPPPDTDTAADEEKPAAPARPWWKKIISPFGGSQPRTASPQK